MSYAEVNKYQQASATHGNQGIQSVVMLHDQALAAIARAKSHLPENTIQCDIQLCEAAEHLLAISELVAKTPFAKLSETIARFMIGIVTRLHKATKTPNPSKTLDELAESIVILQKQWKEMNARSDALHESTKESGAADIKV